MSCELLSYCRVLTQSAGLMRTLTGRAFASICFILLLRLAGQPCVSSYLQDYWRFDPWYLDSLLVVASQACLGQLHWLARCVQKNEGAISPRAPQPLRIHSGSPATTPSLAKGSANNSRSQRL